MENRTSNAAIIFNTQYLFELAIAEAKKLPRFKNVDLRASMFFSHDGDGDGIIVEFKEHDV